MGKMVGKSDSRSRVQRPALAAVAAALMLLSLPAAGASAADDPVTPPAPPAPPPALSKSGSPMFAAQLLYDVRARSTHVATAQSVRYLHELTPFNGGRMTIPILERKLVDGAEWIRVILPGRPNNRTGWIPAKAARIIRTSWRIRVDVTRRALAVFKDGRQVGRFGVVVGTRSTPTPRGRFFVMEKVILGTRWSPNGRALALSAYSDVLRHYDGGEGQVAIHARGTLEGALGSASSHGCVRVDDNVALWLARRIPDGTYVEIVG